MPDHVADPAWARALTGGAAPAWWERIHEAAAAATVAPFVPARSRTTMRCLRRPETVTGTPGSTPTTEVPVFQRVSTTRPAAGRHIGPALLVGACALAAAGCSGTGEPVHPTLFGSPISDGHHVTAARGTLSEARLDLVSGTDSVVVTTADLGDRLFEADTPADAPQAPHATSNDGLVSVSLTDRPGTGARQVRIVLNSTVVWTVSLDGGAVDEHVDLTGAKLRSLIFAAGSSSVTALLPKPSGDVTVLMAGGASAYLVQAPAGVATSVDFAGGAGSAVIDGTPRSGIGGGTVVAAPGWASAADRYTFDNSAGVSSFTLTRAA